MIQLQKNNSLKLNYLGIGTIYVFVTSLSSLTIFGYGVVTLQFFLLFLLLVYKPILAIPYLILSFGSSLEFNVFINNGQEPLYNLSNIKLIGLNLGIWMFIFILPTTIYRILNLRKKISFNFWQLIIIIWFIIMYSIAVIISVINFIFVDDGLSKFNFGYLTSLSYLQFWPFICLFLMIVYIKIYENGLLILKLTIIYTIISVLISCFLVNILGFRGTYSNSPYYFSPTLIFISPLFLVLLKDSIFRISRKIALLIFFCLIVLPIIFLDLAGGKIIILTLIALLMFNKQYKFRNILFAFSIITLLFITIYASMNDESLLKSKIDEVISLFNFFSGNWYELLEPSTRFRFDEFINIFQHYKLNPIFSIIGFGIVAGAPDYIYGYGLFQDGGFPQIEYTFNYFISYHEITSFLIKYGLSGLLLLLLIIIKAYKYKESLPFLVVGTMWLILFWGYSFTLAIIGAAILAVGIMEIPPRNLKFKAN